MGAVPGITDTRRLSREASTVAEQDRLRREAERIAAEVEQEWLQREAQERVAAEAAE